MEPIIYVAIYSLEAFCTLTASYMLFRFPFREFIWKKILLCILLSIFSYLVRDITVVNKFTIIVPLTYLVSYTLFIHFVSKIRLTWASIMMTTGYAVIGIVQMIVLLLFDALGIDMASVQQHLSYLVFAQILSVAIVFPFLFLYYYRGAGFTFEFPAWQWKQIWLVILEVILLALILRFILMNNLSMIISVVVALTALLILSRKMEQEERSHELEQ